MSMYLASISFQVFSIKLFKHSATSPFVANMVSSNFLKSCLSVSSELLEMPVSESMVITFLIDAILFLTRKYSFDLFSDSLSAVRFCPFFIDCLIISE